MRLQDKKKDEKKGKERGGERDGEKKVDQDRKVKEREKEGGEEGRVRSPEFLMERFWRTSSSKQKTNKKKQPNNRDGTNKKTTKIYLKNRLGLRCDYFDT